MIRALWTAGTGMNVQQTNLDVIANNIANVNTNGFKKSRADMTAGYADSWNSSSENWPRNRMNWTRTARKKRNRKLRNMSSSPLPIRTVSCQSVMISIFRSNNGGKLWLF